MSDKSLARAQPSALCLLLLVLLTGLTVSVFAIAVQASMAVLASCFLFGLAGVCVARWWGKREARLFMWVYCSAVLAAIVLYVIYSGRYGTPYFAGGSDDLKYELNAKDAASSLGIFDYFSIRGRVVKQTHNSVGYVYLVSLLYRAGETLGGFHTMLPRFLNCLALGLLAIVTYRLGQRYGLTECTSARAALFVGFLPITVYTTIHTFRDTIVSLLTIWVVYVWSSRSDTFSFRERIWLWLQTMVIVGIVSQLRRSQAVAILAIALVGDLLSSGHRVRPFSTEGMHRLVMVALCCITLVTIVQDEASEFIERLGLLEESYARYRIGLSDGLSTYVFGAPAPLTYLLRAVYALVTPIPVLSRKLERLWLSIGTTIRYLFLPFLTAGIVLSLRDRAKRQLLSGFVLLFSGTAFISFTSRHVVQFLPYGALLTGIGFERFRRRKFAVWIAMVWFGFGLVLAYVVLTSA